MFSLIFTRCLVIIKEARAAALTAALLLRITCYPWGLVALNDSVGFDRDRYPLCKIGMFDQDFQQLFQSFFVVVHFYHLLSTLLLYIF